MLPPNEGPTRQSAVWNSCRFGCCTVSSRNRASSVHFMVRAIPFVTELTHKFMKEIQNCPKQKQTSQPIYYNAMMGSVRATIVAVESNNYYII